MKKQHKKHNNDLRDYKKAANSMKYNEFEEMYDNLEENKNDKKNNKEE